MKTSYLVSNQNIKRNFLSFSPFGVYIFYSRTKTLNTIIAKVVGFILAMFVWCGVYFVHLNQCFCYVEAVVRLVWDLLFVYNNVLKI